MGFDQSVRFVLEAERGYVFDPNDPGGETNFGISKRAYPHLDIKNLTVNQAIDIYKKDYWDRGRCELLPDNLQLIYFDACVNQGLSSAAIDLQRAIEVRPQDGIVGPKTLRAAHSWPKGERLTLFAAERARRYAMSVNFDRYGRGWLARLFRATLASSMS